MMAAPCAENPCDGCARDAVGSAAPTAAVCASTGETSAAVGVSEDVSLGEAGLGEFSSGSRVRYIDPTANEFDALELTTPHPPGRHADMVDRGVRGRGKHVCMPESRTRRPVMAGDTVAVVRQAARPQAAMLVMCRRGRSRTVLGHGTEQGGATLAECALGRGVPQATHIEEAPLWVLLSDQEYRPAEGP